MAPLLESKADPEAQSELAALGTEVEAFKAENQKLQRKISETIVEFQGKLAVEEEKLKKMAERAEQLKGQADEDSKLIKDMIEEREEILAKNKDLEAQIQQNKTQLGNLERQLKEKNTKIEVMTSEGGKLVLRVEEIKKRLRRFIDLEKDHKEIQVQVEELRQSKKANEETIERMELKLAESEELRQSKKANEETIEQMELKLLEQEGAYTKLSDLLNEREWMTATMYENINRLAFFDDVRDDLIRELLLSPECRNNFSLAAQLSAYVFFGEVEKSTGANITFLFEIQSSNSRRTLSR